jgi:hypothetical protein
MLDLVDYLDANRTQQRIRRNALRKRSLCN